MTIVRIMKVKYYILLKIKPTEVGHPIVGFSMIGF